MPDEPDIKTEPQTFADLANQPSGSGVAAEQAAYMEAALEDAAAQSAIDPLEIDSAATHPDATTPTLRGPDESESEAQPS